MSTIGVLENFSPREWILPELMILLLAIPAFYCGYKMSTCVGYKVFTMIIGCILFFNLFAPILDMRECNRSFFFSMSDFTMQSLNVSVCNNTQYEIITAPNGCLYHKQSHIILFEYFFVMLAFFMSGSLFRMKRKTVTGTLIFPPADEKKHFLIKYWMHILEIVVAMTWFIVMYFINGYVFRIFDPSAYWTSIFWLLSSLIVVLFWRPITELIIYMSGYHYSVLNKKTGVDMYSVKIQKFVELAFVFIAFTIFYCLDITLVSYKNPSAHLVMVFGSIFIMFVSFIHYMFVRKDPFDVKKLNKRVNDLFM